MQILDGKALSEEILTDLKKKIESFSVKPQLHIIFVGNDFGSQIYVNLKKKKAESIGIICSVHKFPEDAGEEEALNKINELNLGKNITGILVQLPLPKQIDKLKIINSVNPKKDVDGLTAENIGLLFQGKPRFIPATPLGIFELLNHYKIDLIGKNVVIIGSSLIVGIPLFAILKNAGATVTICDEFTKKIKEITQTADILVSATGVQNLIRNDWVKNSAIVIDVGSAKNEKGKICGDVDFENVKKKTSFITPVPGGVGPMTVASLLKNVVNAYKQLV